MCTHVKNDMFCFAGVSVMDGTGESTVMIMITVKKTAVQTTQDARVCCLDLNVSCSADSMAYLFDFFYSSLGGFLII